MEKTMFKAYYSRHDNASPGMSVPVSTVHERTAGDVSQYSI